VLTLLMLRLLCSFVRRDLKLAPALVVDGGDYYGLRAGIPC
jgi:hypothetical protein